jgi:hypothetical protein
MFTTNELQQLSSTRQSITFSASTVVHAHSSSTDVS